MLQESLACGHQRAHRPEAFLRRGEKGATTSEYLVIAGVVVAIVLAVAGTFRTEISNAITILGCNISAGAGGGTGNCGGGSSASTAGSAGNPAGTGGPLKPGQLVQVPPAGTGGATSSPGPYVPPHLAGTAGGGPGGGIPSAGGGPMAPGGPTVTPGFGTLSSALGAASKSASAVAGEGLELVAGAVPLPGSPGLPLKDTGNATIARYGNWVGSGWSGGSEMPDKVGAQPPVDALDALGQAHDFGYAVAEEAGRLYGEAEKNRLLALADEIGYRAWQKLDPDPNKWVPRPKDIAAAKRYYDRFPAVMQGMAYKHEQDRLKADSPNAQQLAALKARGPRTAADLQREQNRRVQTWNKDRGTNMRAKGSWK
jgi:Flp pilus assembly pilin Flp